MAITMHSLKQNVNLSPGDHNHSFTITNDCTYATNQLTLSKSREGARAGGDKYAGAAAAALVQSSKSGGRSDQKEGAVAAVRVRA